ncbi:MAG TPA: glycerate kinase [Cyclobacteriaceae bacterium]|nr:glycerate kinase [Cyclobacteriaceae bacterium]
MNILICPDKFKGSLTAPEVCDAVAEGLLKKYPGATIIKLPLADGGEGTATILTHYFNGKILKAKVHGPLFEPIEAEYGTDNGTTAFIEMASASGFQLINKDKRDPLHTTTFGTGELIRHAIDNGATKIILGIGGSSTNDAGIGMAEALGYKFFDSDRNQLKPTGENLVHIHHIEVPEGIRDLEVTALCDVNNPLYGPNGAAHVYGPQKGATPGAVELLDRGLVNFERVAKKTFGKSADFAGAGAGGGIAGGASVFFNLTVRSGIQYVMETLQVLEKIRAADLVITGEGKIDRQTLAGKVVASVARQAVQFNKKLVAICGVCELRKNELEKIGVSEIISLTDPFTSGDEAMKNARDLIVQKVALIQ